MAKKDWYNLGDDIRDIVQNAIDSQDFDKLNQTITNAVNGAMKSVEAGIRSAGAAADEVHRRNQEEHTVRAAEKQGFKEALPRQRRSSELFVSTTKYKVLGTVFMAVGYSIGGFLGFSLFVALMVGGFDGTILSELPMYIVLGVMVGLFFWMAGYGTKTVSRTKRFRKYIQGLQGRTYADIRMLADGTGKPMKFVKKDLKWMIEKGWFIEGHLDPQGSCLMVTHQVYEEFVKTARHSEELKRQQEQEAAAARKALEESGVSPEVQAVIEEGDAYISRIRKSNDAIPGEEISEKISRMELIVQRIFERVEQHPENIPDIRKMMEYYLPTTVKLLVAYEELDHQPVQGENIINAKKEIEGTLDTLIEAFEKLLDGLFKDTAWDVSTDISVLQTMLAQEGLTGKDF